MMLTDKAFSIPNPKKTRGAGRETWYPYYAGFSQEFATSVLGQAGLKNDALVLDPWNGSGTTTRSASLHGYTAIGLDINPVSVILAKGRDFPTVDTPSISPLLRVILSDSLSSQVELNDEPLQEWFTPDACVSFRSIEIALRKLLTDTDDYAEFSALAAFFYIALFRTVRQHMASLKTSNPTWVRLRGNRARLEVSGHLVRDAFQGHVEQMKSVLRLEAFPKQGRTSMSHIRLASSEKIPLESDSVDFVLSSPPYCTRIDYGVSTLPELAILRLNARSDLRKLRDATIGTTTITGVMREPQASWGEACNRFLEKVATHESRASKSYYLKTFVQYFSAINNSIGEISRCLKVNSCCCIVVQDSFYKDIYNDLSQTFAEMASAHSLAIESRQDFEVTRNLAGIHTHVRRYRKSVAATESVLLFRKVC